MANQVNEHGSQFLSSYSLLCLQVPSLLSTRPIGVHCGSWLTTPEATETHQYESRRVNTT